MYHYQNLEHVSLRDISRCLNAAFSDYSVPVRLSEADLSGLFLASGIDRRLSFGAFFEGQLVGCMLNSRGIYQGCRAAFDVTTGVIPEHRGKQVFAGLFDPCAADDETIPDSAVLSGGTPAKHTGNIPVQAAWIFHHEGICCFQRQYIREEPIAGACAIYHLFQI